MPSHSPVPVTVTVEQQVGTEETGAGTAAGGGRDGGGGGELIPEPHVAVPEYTPLFPQAPVGQVLLASCLLYPLGLYPG